MTNLKNTKAYKDLTENHSDWLLEDCVRDSSWSFVFEEHHLETFISLFSLSDTTEGCLPMIDEGFFNFNYEEDELRFTGRTVPTPLTIQMKSGMITEGWKPKRNRIKLFLSNSQKRLLSPLEKEVYVFVLLTISLFIPGTLIRKDKKQRFSHNQLKRTETDIIYVENKKKEKRVIMRLFQLFSSEFGSPTLETFTAEINQIVEELKQIFLFSEDWARSPEYFSGILDFMTHKEKIHKMIMSDKRLLLQKKFK